jgi:hypothetical protein
VLIVHEDRLRGGIGAEIAAYLGEHLFTALDAPISRIGAADTPVPYAPPLETAYLPSVDRIYEGIVRLAESRQMPRAIARGPARRVGAAPECSAASVRSAVPRHPLAIGGAMAGDPVIAAAAALRDFRDGKPLHERGRRRRGKRGQREADDADNSQCEDAHRSPREGCAAQIILQGSRGALSPSPSTP